VKTDGISDEGKAKNECNRIVPRCKGLAVKKGKFPQITSNCEGSWPENRGIQGLLVFGYDLRHACGTPAKSTDPKNRSSSQMAGPIRSNQTLRTST